MTEFKNINEMMEKLLEAGIPGNDIIIYLNGKEVYRSYRGYSDIENKISMNGKEKYNMYSCSKIVTAAAILQLVEKSLIRLDDALYNFIPDFKEMYLKNGEKAKNKITIRQLLTMTGGFSYDTYSPSLQRAKKETGGKCPTLETIKYLADEPLLFEPGTKWEYSLCHDILAGVVETVSGMKFGEYVRENIFNPLHMDNSTFLLPDNALDSICAQYRMNDKGEAENCGKTIQNGYKTGSEYESGGAGLISTVEDYIKFLEALRVGDVILKKETINLMQNDMMEDVDTSGIWFSPYSYGLGVRCAPKNNTEITDFGWGGAAGAYAIVDKANNYTVFYAMHVLNAGDLDGRKGILNAVRKDLGI